MRSSRLVSFLLVAAFTAATPLQAQTVLFSDNFNRTAEAGGDTNRLSNVDFSIAGMGGLLMSNGNLSVSNAWLEPVDAALLDESKSQISTNDRVLLAVGFGTSHIVVNYNFASQISTSGVLSVQVAVPEWPTLDGTPLHRYLGFGIGGADYEFNVNGDRMLSRVADLFVALTQDGQVRINDEEPFTRAAANDLAPTLTVDLDSTSTAFIPGILRADLTFTDTDSGTTVVYDVFFDSGKGGGFVTVAKNRTFKWSGQDELYIGLDGRSSNRAPGDDFSVTFTESFISPEVTLTITPNEVGRNTASNVLNLNYITVATPPGSTYRFVADKAVSFPFLDSTGNADYPYPIQAVVDGTLGDVTFTVYISNNVPALIAQASAKVTAVEESPTLLSNLFADNFNRVSTIPDPNNIDSSTDGMSGLFSPMTYLETFEGANISDTTNYNDAVTLITYDLFGNEVCSMANGPVMSTFGLDHNFTNGVILTEGGFSVAMDVTGINTATDDAGDRYSGFGVGLSRAEINAFIDENTGNLSGPRGAVEGEFRNAGMADFFVSLALNNNLQVFAGGVVIDRINVSTNRGRVRADFGASDFAAGSFVAYKVYFDRLLKAQGFFRWSGNQQNYVAVSSRGSISVTLDNLAIGTVNVPFIAPAEHPALISQLTGLTPAVPPFTSAQVSFSSVAGVTYRADVAALVTEPFLPAGGAVGGEAVFAATNSATVGNLNVPPAFVDTGFIRVQPVHWPGPIHP